MAPAADQVLATAGILLWAAPSQAWENLFFCLLLWGSWAVGLLTRRSRQHAEHLGRLAARLDAERELAESTAVAEERARIARDVHDSVAHSVSVMVLQLGALRTTVEPGSRVAEVLQGVERLGRQSVDELRGLVGVLRETPTGPPRPAPSLSRLPSCSRRCAPPACRSAAGGRRAGRPAAGAGRLGRPGAAGGPQQRAPARRPGADDGVRATGRGGPHGPGGRRRPGPRRPADGIGGHGLLGIRERVAMFGGTVEAGPRPEGGFRLAARFPLQDAR